jgi:hypothetical protein
LFNFAKNKYGTMTHQKPCIFINKLQAMMKIVITRQRVAVDAHRSDMKNKRI